MFSEKILVIQLRQLGDILLTTPCLREIRRQRPQAQIVALTHEMGRLILNDSPYVDEHFTYNPSQGKWSELQLARTLAKRDFAIVFDFMNNPRSAFYTWMTRAPLRVAFRSRRALAYNKMIPRRGGYIVNQKLALLEAAGLAKFSDKADDAGPALALPWFERDARPLLKLWGENEAFRSTPLRITLSPTHRRPARIWPAAYYAQLADQLQREWHACVMWVWGPGEEAYVDHIQSLCTKPTLKSPKTTFREMAALIANSDLFIGNSNGPSHVAVAVETASLQLHGPTLRDAWSPLSSEHRALQATDGDLKRLKVEDVWQELEAMRPLIDRRRAEREPERPSLSWRHL